MPYESDETIASALETTAELIPASILREKIVDEPGFYSIFVDVPDALPEPFNAHLRRKQTNLLYIGIATDSLLTRLVDQDLHHQKGPSTFFRASKNSHCRA
jgi:hypothetical protein